MRAFGAYKIAFRQVQHTCQYMVYCAHDYRIWQMQCSPEIKPYGVILKLIRFHGQLTDCEGACAPGQAQALGAEAAHSCNKFRKLHIRHEKTTISYRGLCMLATAIIALRKVGIIYG